MTVPSTGIRCPSDTNIMTWRNLFRQAAEEPTAPLKELLELLERNAHSQYVTTVSYSSCIRVTFLVNTYCTRFILPQTMWLDVLWSDEDRTFCA